MKLLNNNTHISRILLNKGLAKHKVKIYIGMVFKMMEIDSAHGWLEFTV